MSVVTITPLNISALETGLNITAATAVTDGENGCTIAPTRKNEQLLIELVADGSNDTDFTFEQGDGYAATQDKLIAVPAGESHFVQVEFGRFLNTTGTYKGKIHITVANNADSAVAEDGASVRCFQTYL